jgi:hypothetical protein
MEKLPWLDKAANFLIQIFKPMGRYVEKSSFPQVTKLYFLFMTLHAPAHFFYVHRSFENTFEDRRKKAQQLGRKSLHADFLLAFVIAPACAFYFFYLNPGRALGITPIHDSRFALAAFGWLYAGAMGWLLLGAAKCSIHERFTGKLK